MSEKTCETCKWWKLTGTQEWGECREERDAKYGVYDTILLNGGYLDCRRDFGCRLHEPKEETPHD